LPIDFLFFDIGGTLGDRDATGKLVPFASTFGLLAAIRNRMGLRMGVITTLGGLTNQQGRNLLTQAGLADFFDPAGFVSEHDVGDQGKPSPAIYRFAAQAAGVPIGRCLYVGENLIEVIGAKAAGMEAILKPCPPGRDLPN
jgi:HAD superfamily hydrolase (TIGR01509 family)